MHVQIDVKSAFAKVLVITSCVVIVNDDIFLLLCGHGGIYCCGRCPPPRRPSDISGMYVLQLIHLFRCGDGLLS